MAQHGDPLRPMPMTHGQVADLVARVRARTTPRGLAAARATAMRWERYRMAKQAQMAGSR